MCSFALLKLFIQDESETNITSDAFILTYFIFVKYIKA